MKYLKTAGNIIAYFLICFLAQILVGFVFGIFLAIQGGGHVDSSVISKNTVLISAFSDFVALLIFIPMFKNKEENLMMRCRFNKTKVSSIILSILTAIGLMLVSSSFLYLTQNIFKDYDKVVSNISAGERNIFGVICVVVLIPIFEEIFFRGLIFNELRKNISLLFSIVIQALIFALAHGNVKQGAYAFVLGIITAVAYTWTKSIWSNIAIHITFNLFGSIPIPDVLYNKISVVIYIILGIGIIVFSLNRMYKNKKVSDEGVTNTEFNM